MLICGLEVYSTAGSVCCVLTSSADVDVQVALDDRAALEGLGGIHGVDDLLVADLVTQAVAG